MADVRESKVGEGVLLQGGRATAARIDAPDAADDEDSTSPVCLRGRYAADAFLKRRLVEKSWQQWRVHHKKKRALWKQQLLAKHHAQYSLLWRSFNTWRQRTSEMRVRKQVGERVVYLEVFVLCAYNLVVVSSFLPFSQCCM